MTEMGEDRPTTIPVKTGTKSRLERVLKVPRGESWDHALQRMLDDYEAAMKAEAGKK